MNVSKASLWDFGRAVEAVSPAYSDNLVVHADAHPLSGNRFVGRLAVQSSKDPGARRSWSGRRIPAACWHAYRDVLTTLFERCPDATVRTMLATYRGRAGFEANYPATAELNIGSQMRPAYMPDLCECDGAELAAYNRSDHGSVEVEIHADVSDFDRVLADVDRTLEGDWHDAYHWTPGKATK